MMLPQALPSRRVSKAAVKRDQQVRAHVRRLRSLATHLDDPRYLPLLRSFVEISLLVERSYAHLREDSLLNPETGEVRTSVDTFRRLADTQRGLARELGLSPTVASSFAKAVKPMIDIEALRDELDNAE